MKRLLTVADIAAEIGCGRRTAYALMHEMPVISISPSSAKRPVYAVDRADFDRWLNARKTYPQESEVITDAKADKHYSLQYR